MKNMKFVKMEGLANDFILTHYVSGENAGAIGKIAPVLCDRRRGIGADGVILVLPSRTADYQMRIFNADGSEPEMCGNGIRCFALYVQKTGLWKKPALSVETIAGIIKTEISGDRIKVTMGAPIVDAPRVPVAKQSGQAIMEPIHVDGEKFFVTAVSMGNPHAVIYVDELTDEMVLGYGKKLESHAFFPRKTNVEFVKVLSDKEISMRVFERGCGETMACGTGACASVVSGVINKKHGNSVTVHLLGGDLFIEWDGELSHPVYMTGPAKWVFEGDVEL
jgi:diaminopimelate epimerase